jgi:hypothetical protein
MSEAQSQITRHQPVTTLRELLTLDDVELMAGHMSAEKGDPESGMNHTRSFHHGWRTRMMDLGEIPITPGHRKLTSEWVAWNKARKAS